MWLGYLADVIVGLHVAYVAFVLIGQLAIIAGAVWGWEWVRNFWFRAIHLAAVGIVGLEALWGVDCPLTLWENALRRLAGQEVADATFVGRWLHDLLFVEVPISTLNAIHIGVALLVIATFVIWPPRRPAAPFLRAKRITRISSEGSAPSAAADE
jgi:hypothetical protein